MKIFISISIVIIICLAAYIFYSNQQKQSIVVINADESVEAVIVQPVDNNSEENSATLQNEKEKETLFPRPPEIIDPTAFINADDTLKMENLIGEKVILVKFWTFGCVNCQHTLPYVNEWYEKYKDDGLEIVSFHTPEFAYEHNLANVKNAAQKWGIQYPVILDNEFKNFRAYENRYWPHMYLVDKGGFIVYDHIGQGGYEETEVKIKELLLEM